MRLRLIRPWGVFPSTLKDIEMFGITMPNIFILGADVRLGGLYSPLLLAATPAGLVPPGVPGANPAPNNPAGDFDHHRAGIRTAYSALSRLLTSWLL